MIGRLRGILLEKQAPSLLIDVGGVGYDVSAPLSTFFQLPECGHEVVLHIHHVVREDAQLLFGFAEQRDRELFRALIKVNGVGPKLALTILSGIEPDQFVRCVQNGDVAALVKLPGVGRKTAERLLVEMKDKLDDWAPTANETGVVHAQTGGSQNQMVAEAESALIALGYKPPEAARAIAAVIDDSLDTSEALIRQALRGMVKG
ncbi:MAG: Holliday junction branch migration protein RuvA [Pseudomonadales bacterium]